MGTGSVEKMSSTRQQAYLLYLEGVLTNSDIAKQVNVSPSLLRKWIGEDNWHRDRAQLAQEQMAVVREGIRKVMVEQRLGEVQRQLEIGNQIQQALLISLQHRNDLELPTTGNQLRDFSIALKNVSDVTAKMLGLTEHSISLASGEAEGKSTGTSVNVNFNVSGGVKPLAPGDRERVQDITKDVEVFSRSQNRGTSVTVEPARPPASASSSGLSPEPLAPPCPF